MYTKPRICFGMTLYNNAKYLPEAIESLLNQTYSDFHLVAVDDCSTDETEELMRKYAAQDKRISYFRNDEWSGMITTWRKAFYKAYELHKPDYFAWASDHDKWDAAWLRRHIDVLENSEKVVLAYPRTVPISDRDEVLEIEQHPLLDTFDMTVIDRLYSVSSKPFNAGNLVYGLFRVEPLKKAGVFRYVLTPDKLLLMEISSYGTIKAIDEELWYRRFISLPKTKEETIKDQQQKLFGPSPTPLHAYCPYLTIALNLAFSLSIMPEDNDYSNCLSGLILATVYSERYRTIIRQELKDIAVRIGHEIPSTALPEKNRINPHADLPDDYAVINGFGAVAESLKNCFPVDASIFSELKNICIIALVLKKNMSHSELRDEIARMKNRAQRQNDLLEKIKAKNEALGEANEGLKELVEKIRVKYEASREANEGLKELVEKIRVKYEASREENEGLKELVEKIRAKYEASREENEELKKHVESLKSENLDRHEEANRFRAMYEKKIEESIFEVLSKRIRKRLERAGK
jgi:hypothetical protein